MKPRIAVLFAGGTMGMVPERTTGALHPGKTPAAILDLFLRLRKKLSLEFVHLFNIDSSNMTPAHWRLICEKIREIYDSYEGFVIIHGTDTLAYSASALSFALRDLSKPIVLTGSLVPLSELGADAHNNFIYACLVAVMDIAEVCIVFGNKILRGNRAKKNHESFVDVFHSPNFPKLGEIERPIRLFEWRKKRRKRVLKYMPQFESNIRLIKLFPGFQSVSIERMVGAGAKGIVMEGYGPGNMPFLEMTVFPVLEKAIKQGVPVVVASQMEKGITNLRAYEAGYKALEIGAISSHDMTTEATITKLMWVLSRTSDMKKIKDLMESDIAGELTQS